MIWDFRNIFCIDSLFHFYQVVQNSALEKILFWFKLIVFNILIPKTLEFLFYCLILLSLLILFYYNVNDWLNLNIKPRESCLIR